MKAICIQFMTQAGSYIYEVPGRDIDEQKVKAEQIVETVSLSIRNHSSYRLQHDGFTRVLIPYDKIICAMVLEHEHKQPADYSKFS